MKKLLLKAAIVPLLLILATPLFAVASPFYLTTGTVWSEHKLRQDGFWQQHDMPHEINDTSTGWKIGLVGYPLDWLGVEGSVVYTGMYSNFLKFCSDQDYSDTKCRALHDGWTTHAYGVGESRIAELSLLPTFRLGDFSAHARLGATYYWTRYEVYAIPENDKNESVGSLALYGNPTYVSGVNCVVGVGLGYQWKKDLGVRLEVMMYPDISGSDTAHDAVTASSLNALITF